MRLQRSIRLMTAARAIRWIGWGFGEAFLPIFLLHLSKTFTDTGLLKSLYEIVSIATLPLIGAWADRLPGKSMVITSLAIYPVIGLGYLLAGFTGVVAFAAVSLGLNGFLWELENIGVATYLRRLSPRGAVSSTFG